MVESFAPYWGKARKNFPAMRKFANRSKRLESDDASAALCL